MFTDDVKVGIPLVTSTDVAVKPKNRRGAAKKYDWPSIRTAYVEGLPKPKAKDSDPDEREWLTLDETAKKFGVVPETVRKMSAKERWPEQRQAYQVRLAATRRQKRILELSKEAVDMDKRVMSSAKLGITMVQTRLGEIARDVQTQNLRRQEAERRLAAGLVVDPDDFKTVIDARELGVLASAAAGYQSLARIALGEDIVKHEHSGVDGAPIEVDVEHTHSIKDEMQRDDPDRLSALLDAMERANLLQGEAVDEDEDDIEDAELVEP